MRRGRVFKRCGKCNATVKDRVCKCGAARSFTWAYAVDVAPRGEARKQRMKAGFRTRDEAQAALGDVLADLSRGNYVVPDRTTLGTYLDREWLPAVRLRGLRPSTLASYEMVVRHHLVPALGKKSLQTLAVADLNSFYAGLLHGGRRDGQGLSRKSVRNIHVILHRALKDAVRWGRVVRNVAEAADPPGLRDPSKREMDTWSAEQLRHFLESVREDRDYALWLLYATTGARRGEALGVRWKDINLDSATWAVRQTLVSVDYDIQFSTPKTARGRRTIALDGTSVAALKAHRKRQARERLALGPHYQDSDLVFARPDGSPVHPQAVSGRFEKLVALSALPPIRLHDLRHTHASLALGASVPVKVVSERLGHSSVAFTLDVYAHVIPGMQEDAAEKVAALFAPRPAVSES